MTVKEITVMKQTSLNFIQGFLFDPEYHKTITDLILDRGHRHDLRITWNGKLERVPTVLFNNIENAQTFWILIRNVGDVELRTALPLDQYDPDSVFAKMPVGIQRAIAIFVPKDQGDKIGWRLYQTNALGETSEAINGNINTFSQQRKSAKWTPYKKRSFK